MSASLFDVICTHAPTSWKKKEIIGSGAFGDVFLVEDLINGSICAVKKVPYLPDNREAISRVEGMEHDVRQLARLRHPRILSYLGIQKIGDSMHVFMEWMCGGNIKQLINKCGKLEQKLALRYIGQIFEGLSFIHGIEIIHCDLKTVNLLRDSVGNVKIADFGSAIRLDEMKEKRRGFNGTVHFTAPEVLLDSSTISKPADVWSCGICLVEMLTGQAPLSDMSPEEAMFTIAYENPNIEYPSTIEPSIPALVDQILQMEPGNRPSALQILESNLFGAWTSDS